MPTIARALIDYDLDLLRIIAAQWDVDLLSGERAAAADELSGAIANPQAVEATWERLDEETRQALAELLLNDGQMPYSHFTRRYGELRPMGPARREREKPWLEPASTTEALFYRGLIVRIFEQAPTGAQEFIAIPGDLAPYLPAGDIVPTAEAPGHAVAPPRKLNEGYPTAPDDIATLIAYLLLHDSNAQEWLTNLPIPVIDRHLRHPDMPAYRALLTQLAYDLELIADEQTLTHIVTRVNRDVVKAWLDAPRLHQLRALAEAWQATGWNELAYTPGLEADQWPNNPIAARHAILEALKGVPAEIWWGLDSFIVYLKEVNPDFQRPSGDYGAWYLRDAWSGEILHGFQYWDHVEGGLIRFMIEGPLRWLGLVRAGRGTLLLTSLGLALQGRADWPSDPDREASIRIDQQGLISVPIHLSRYDRLQIARFAAWVSTPAPAAYMPGQPHGDDGLYVYRLTPQAIERVLEEGVSIQSHIVPFLQRLSAHSVPDNVLQMLQSWQEEPKEIIVHDVVLVTAKDLGVYERIRANRRVSRWLGQQIGPHAHIVKREDMPALMNALREMGILPLFEGHEKDNWPQAADEE